MFRTELKALFRRATRLQIGSITFETSTAQLQARLIASVEDERALQALVQKAVESLPRQEEVPAGLESDPRLSTLPVEYAQRGLIPFMDACVDRLEYVSGIPGGTLRRYVTLRANALETYLAPGTVGFVGYMEERGQVTVASLLLDYPGFTGQNEIINATGALLWAMDCVYGDEKQWKLVVGVVEAREDTVGRIQAAQQRFAPAVRSGKVAIVELTWSEGMFESLQRGMLATLEEWERSPENPHRTTLDF